MNAKTAKKIPPPQKKKKKTVLKISAPLIREPIPGARAAAGESRAT